jgi:ribosomal protein S8
MESQDHVYSSENIKSIRKILRASEKQWPDRRLHRHTEELALMIIHFVKMERTILARQRLLQIENRLERPINAILKALKDEDFIKEFRQYYGKLKLFDLQLEMFLNKAKTKIKGHKAVLRSFLRKGRRWDTDLKNRLAYLVEESSEYVNNDFEPTRNVANQLLCGTPLVSFTP